MPVHWGGLVAAVGTDLDLPANFATTKTKEGLKQVVKGLEER